jgi:hypothetical protein
MLGNINYLTVRNSTSLKNKCIVPMGSSGLFLSCEEKYRGLVSCILAHTIIIHYAVVSFGSDYGVIRNILEQLW